MTLRAKLLISYLIFVAALILLGGWSAWRLREMGGVSRRIITNNYDSVVAAQEMKESLERQDSTALFLLLGAREKALSHLHDYRAQFDLNFQKAENNITEIGETSAIEAIRRDRDLYYQVFDSFLALESTQTSANTTADYFSRLEPQFNKLRADCEHLLQLNQRAMLAKSEDAASVAQLWFYRTLLVAGLLVGAGLLLAFLFANKIVEPLLQLTVTTRKIAGGDLDARVALNSRDEVGLLGLEYNRMADRLRQLRNSDLGKLLVAQQITEAAIDSLYDPVIVTDAEGLVTKLNHAAEEIFGSEREHAGKAIEEVARNTPIAFAVTEAIEYRRPVASEGISATLPLPVNGSTKAFRFRTTPMHDNDQQLLGAVTLLEDVTHLHQIDQLKSDFITTASQELRSPLTSVQMGIHLLLEDAAGELNSKQAEILIACREDCERLDKLMQDLLELSKIETGETELKMVPINPSELLADAALELRPQVEASGLSFRMDVSGRLPKVMADRSQINEVFGNLVINAIHHTKEGEIRFGAESLGSYIAFSVTDTGPGIPHEHLTHVFDRFVQVAGAANGATGLGLAIARAVVEAHGGQISVRSALGHGSTFTFTLAKCLTSE